MSFQLEGRTVSWLELRVPPPVLAALVALALWHVPLGGFAWHAPAVLRHALTVLFAVVGAVFMIAGVVEIRRARTTINPLTPHAATSLVASGVFRFTRNPMYVGGTLLLASWAVHLFSPWALLGPVCFALYIHRFQIAPEERVLSSLFGAEYSAYRTRVRRWL